MPAAKLARIAQYSAWLVSGMSSQGVDTALRQSRIFSLKLDMAFTYVEELAAKPTKAGLISATLHPGDGKQLSRDED